MKTKIIVLTSIALMLMLLVSANVSPVKAQGPNDTYIEEQIGEPMNADPVFQYDSASLEMLLNIYEPLIFFDFTEPKKFVGLIADSWSGELCDVTDPKTGLHYTQKWTFHIRSGVHFHSSDAIVVPGEGDEVTPEDVEYSFERNMVVDASTGGECLIYDPLLHVGTADPTDELWGRKIDFAVQRNDTARTVTFYLLTPYEPFLQVVAQGYGAIFSKKWSVDPTLHPHNWPGTWPDWTQDNSPTNNYTAWRAYHDPEESPIEEVDCSSSTTHPHLDYILGTGPYMFDYWNKGKGGHYKLVKNPNYWSERGGSWGAHSHVDNYVSYYIEAWETRRDDFKAGTADTVTVPVTFKDQVEGQPGIRVLKDLLMLYCLGEFFVGQISNTSTYIGDIPPNGTFTSTGFPQDGFQDVKLRMAFRALFPFSDFLDAAYLGEAVQPATCVVPGLTYYDPAIPKPTYDRNLAIKLLKEAWGGSESSPGPVWQNGFYMCFVYNEGNEMRKIAAEMLRDEFDSINAEFGTSFHGEVTAVPWGGYNDLWRARVLPYYCVAWGADFPDAHNFVVPFMDSESGAFARFQGFPNATLNQWIRNGIDAFDPSERQYWYTKLQQAYLENCYSFALATPTFRRWERDWVQGWYFHATLLDEDYVYNIWEADPATVTRNTAATVYLAQGSNGKRIVTLQNTGVNPELVEYNEVIKSDGTTIGSQKIEVWIRPGATYSDVKNILAAGTITITAIVRISSKWIPAIGTVNPATGATWKVGDLGGGIPPAFFAFDGAVTYLDSALYRSCYLGTASASAILLGDLGGGIPPAFFAFDGAVTYLDSALYRMCYLGQGPN
jgi:peptide/nickel transport system substrate-binding protein